MTRRVSTEVTWKIKNFSFCWHSKGYSIKSPRFMDAQGKSWNLEFFPRGITSSNSDSACLYIRNIDGENIENSCSVSLLDADGKRQYYKDPRPVSPCTHLYNSIFDFNGILNSRVKYLPEDVLTLSLDIFLQKQTSIPPLQVSLYSRIPIIKTTFNWKITNVCSGKTSKGLCPIDVFEENDLCILELSYTHNPKEKHCLTVGVCGIMQKSHCAKINIQVQDRCFLPSTFVTIPFKQSVVPRASWSEIVADKSNKFSLNGVLSCECDVVLIRKEIEQAMTCGTCEESNQTAMNTQLKRICQFLTKTTQYDAGYNSESFAVTIKHDFKKLLQNGVMTDFTIIVESEQFNVHSTVLSARSAVFQRMLQTDMMEKTDKCLTVDDLSVDTVKRTISYMYTDDPGELNEDIVPSLFYAGDKYELFGLMQMCASFMLNRISDDNVCHVLEMADRHTDPNLKEAVVEYIFAHEEDVVLSKKFQELSKRNPRVVADLNIKLAKLRFK